MALETRVFDPAEYLDTTDGVEAYLADAFEAGDAAEIGRALGVVARAHGMTQLAAETGLNRQALYKALSAEGRPELATIVKVMAALGLRLAPRAVGPEAA